MQYIYALLLERIDRVDINVILRGGGWYVLDCCWLLYFINAVNNRVPDIVPGLLSSSLKDPFSFFYFYFIFTPANTPGVLDISHCLQGRFLYTFDNQINRTRRERCVYSFDIFRDFIVPLRLDYTVRRAAVSEAFWFVCICICGQRIPDECLRFDVYICVNIALYYFLVMGAFTGAEVSALSDFLHLKKCISDVRTLGLLWVEY